MANDEPLIIEDDQKEDLPKWSDIESIRKRPAMYIGDTKFFGFIHYLVSAFDIMLDNGATWIEIELETIDRFQFVDIW